MRNKKRWFLRIQAGLCALCCAVPIACALCLYLDGAEPAFSPQRLAPWLRAALPLFAFTGCFALVGIAAGIQDDRMPRPAQLRVKTPLPPAAKPLLSRLLLAAAALLLLWGVLNGGLRDVLYKAINICTECIGLG